MVGKEEEYATPTHDVGKGRQLCSFAGLRFASAAL
jgi:hypothetical protein